RSRSIRACRIGVEWCRGCSPWNAAGIEPSNAWSGILVEVKIAAARYAVYRVTPARQHRRELRGRLQARGAFVMVDQARETRCGAIPIAQLIQCAEIGVRHVSDVIHVVSLRLMRRSLRYSRRMSQ